MKPFLILAAFAIVVLGLDISARVDLSNSTGSPKHLASGFIYGLPDAPSQIPDRFYTDIDFGYGRAGGARLDAPARGWIWGIEEHRGRLASTLLNYNTCRKYNASFILLLHDIWVTDHANSSTVWPGDGGDLSDYDRFVTQLLADMDANNALDSVVSDIWNEPDLTFSGNVRRPSGLSFTCARTDSFGKSPLTPIPPLGPFYASDVVKIWSKRRAGHRINHCWYRKTQLIGSQSLRADASYPSILISGPTLTNLPMANNTWWTSWLEAVSGNNTVPDQYVYHLEGGVHEPGNDLVYANQSLAALLAQYGLPDRPSNINEYATSAEQRPAGAAWWISRLERYNAIGLRRNWLGDTELHDLMANLLTKFDDPANYTATDYAPAAEFQVYKYYATNMTGNRLATQGSSDALFDVYATVDSGAGTTRVLAGSRVAYRSWNITITGLPGSRTSLNVRQMAFPGTSQWSIMEAPLDLGDIEVSVSDGRTNLPVHTDNTTAWVFDFSV
ncbi:hypothetical protein G647_00557 [Cladophialophora carrionii CBS 160.54]|uniref:Beta-glucuronidase C-terminal domain-containing protein n=1 Tax=Cladophialophora carrionii CBS 160.54 TaxID=1279043 RepID=V9DP67_9EURO|nr:uncharacterized protein G647_00557 [Cladophialophora carrionii CBS 160.54]ETI28108.1 hypothetical protein G647_00557 [Cladophialophora carrionii CBS 160.54]